MFVNDEERQKNENLVLAVLKKMVDSKELISTSMNGITCYKLSAAPVKSGHGMDVARINDTFQKIFHEQAQWNPLAIPKDLTYMIRSTIQSLSKRNNYKIGPSRGTILNYLYKDFKVRKKDKKQVNAVLKEMAISKELIETLKNNGNSNDLYYKLSDNRCKDAVQDM